MKGIIFNLVEQVIRCEYGEEMWEAIIEKGQLDGIYTSLNSYADADFTCLIAVVAKELEMRPQDVLRWIGRSSIPMMADRYPCFFAPHTATIPFLRTLNSIIHPEVRKLHPGAGVPEFGFETLSEQALHITYRSARQLCPFALGLIEGAAAYFGEKITLEKPRCMLRGDAECTFVLVVQEHEI